MDNEQKRILIIEDSRIFADMLMSFLDSPDYILEHAINGFEGIKKTYKFLPHLIISDIEMPYFKGYQVTRFLKSRKNTKTIPIIMFTTLGETKDRFWGIKTGADRYIEKSSENFEPLGEAVREILSSLPDIDFTSIERESKKINDDTIIEIVNNLLDNKLFQTTITGMLNDISVKVQSLDLVVTGIIELLPAVCEAEITTIMIRGSKGILHVYTANCGGFSAETAENFSEINISDFNAMFPDFQVTARNIHNLYNPKNNEKKLVSYITVPLYTGGEKFASVHVANSINEYFTPAMMENINVFLGAASPVISNALSLRELSELQYNTRAAFARYVPADVMDDIINETTKKVLLSENKNISVLFSDIRNFTDISEHSHAQGVVDFLNTWFAKAGSEIISEGGHIDKFIGDSIMAVFGAVQNLENSPSNAIRAAVKMLAVLETINDSGASLLDQKIEIGIGINHGECILGNIGFKNKMDYTVIGDTVNLASRVESLTKKYHHPLIVSENVFEEARDKFLFRKIDNVRVKGKKKPVGIYAVYSGFHGSDSKKLRSGETADIAAVPSLLINRDTLINYNKGIRVFYMREWKLAQEYFLNSLDTCKTDFLSQLYLERAVNFMHNPPPDNWDGVITLDDK
ncbi:MAG: response regulator [Treponema sp.]|nr:response regulator [Treponema sp.]